MFPLLYFETQYLNSMDTGFHLFYIDTATNSKDGGMVSTRKTTNARMRTALKKQALQFQVDEIVRAEFSVEPTYWIHRMPLLEYLAYRTGNKVNPYFINCIVESLFLLGIFESKRHGNYRIYRNIRDPNNRLEKFYEENQIPTPFLTNKPIAGKSQAYGERIRQTSRAARADRKRASEAPGVLEDLPTSSKGREEPS